ncbi:signal recognition particle 9 kDa protein-domain-containing protein [Corynascus similis CBS 632.67]
MPYYAKSEDWLHQSSLLLQARPSTTRITTRYHLKPARRVRKPKNSDQDAIAHEAQLAEAQEKPPRSHLVLKTYDPHSGVTLKYKTSKAAEVTRLIQMLGTLGRRMAAVPVVEKAEDEGMADAPPTEADGAGAGSGVQTPVGQTQQQQQQQQGGGGKGKKKKGGRR